MDKRKNAEKRLAKIRDDVANHMADIDVEFLLSLLKEKEEIINTLTLERDYLLHRCESLRVPKSSAAAILTIKDK